MRRLWKRLVCIVTQRHAYTRPGWRGTGFADWIACGPWTCPSCLKHYNDPPFHGCHPANGGKDAK